MYNAGYRTGLNVIEDIFMSSGTHSFTNCIPGRTIFISMNFGCSNPNGNGLTVLNDRGNYGHHFYIANSTNVNFVMSEWRDGPLFRLE